MKIFDINGEIFNVDIRQSKHPLRAKSLSKQQGLVKSVICRLYPRDIILEDFVIPHSRLSVDFFLPKRDMVIEVQGRQHSIHVPFFQGDRKHSNKYAKQQMNDRKKQEWAEVNSFHFIEIEESDSDEQIITKIRKCN